MELIERADNYAAGKANDAITNAISQAYQDGYRDGYKDCKDEIPADFRDSKTQFIDLGLPSGTLWSDKYEMKDGKILYMPYTEAETFEIPSKEQAQELQEVCRWVAHWKSRLEIDYVTCIGPNGKCIKFNPEGFRKEMKTEEPVVNPGYIYFWLSSLENDFCNKSIKINPNYSSIGTIENVQKDVFSGFKLPLRLVR